MKSAVLCVDFSELIEKKEEILIWYLRYKYFDFDYTFYSIFQKVSLSEVFTTKSAFS